MSLYRPAGPKLPPLTIYVVKRRDYVRSEALRLAYRTIECQNCGKDDGTVCGAHSNWEAHGKGRGIKADDNCAASLCSTCHAMLDQGSAMSDIERKRFWWRAFTKTIRALLVAGRWPHKVPIPEYVTNPWGIAMLTP